MADKTVAVRIVVRANQFSSGLKKASRDTQRFAVDVERATDRAGSSAMALGASSAIAGKLIILGIGGALAVSAKAAIDFESSLAGVAKTTDLAGSAFAKAGSPLASFGQALRSLSLRTPINVNELARIAELGGQLGVEVPNLIDFTETIAALGVSTNLGAEQAATGLARFSNIMGTAQSDFGRLGSVIVELGNNLATTESEILTFALRLAPVGRTVGMTEEEVLGLSGALTSLGIPAERGGTALQRFFIDLQTSLEAGGEQAEKFAALTGMSIESLQELFNESPSQAFLEILRGLDELQDAGGNAAGTLRDLGVVQQRSIQVLLAASNGWETVGEAISLANEEGQIGTALQEEAARRYGTSASQIRILGNAFTDLRIEIGNALLGSGGLAAGLDFFREFIRIIKDNLPQIARLATVLASVAALRLGANLFKPLLQGAQALRSMRAAADGLTRATAAARLGVLGLNTAVFAAITIAGILITKWAMAALEAAELRREARRLQEQIDAGQDPVDAFIQSLEEQEILTEGNRRTLNRLGISVEEFTRQLLSGASGFDARGRTIEEMLGGMVSTAEFFDRLDLGDPLEALNLDERQEQFQNIRDLISGGLGLAEGFLGNRADEIRNALIEAGMGARFTADELEGLSEHLAQRFPFDMDIGGIVSLVGAERPGMSLAEEMEMARNSIETSTTGIGLSWENMVNSFEDGETQIEDFLETSAGGVEDYRDTLTESFLDVKEAILGQFPTWDEYEKKTELSFQAVLDAQNAYLEDLREGMELEAELAGEVSGAVLEFIEELDPATKAALARWRKTNRGEFEEWVTEVGLNLDEANDLLQEKWGSEMPEIQRQGFQSMFNLVVAQAKLFNLPGRQTADAIFDGLSEQMALLSEQERGAYMGFVAAMFQDREFLKSIGLDIGDPIVQGILEALGLLPEKSEPIIRGVVREMEGRFRTDLQSESPSRVFMKVGETIPQGLFKGIMDEFESSFPARVPPLNEILQIPAPVVNLPQASPTNKTSNLTVNLEGTGDPQVDAQRAGAMASIQRRMEMM